MKNYKISLSRSSGTVKCLREQTGLDPVLEKQVVDRL